MKGTHACLPLLALARPTARGLMEDENRAEEDELMVLVPVVNGEELLTRRRRVSREGRGGANRASVDARRRWRFMHCEGRRGGGRGQPAGEDRRRGDVDRRHRVRGVDGDARAGAEERTCPGSTTDEVRIEKEEGTFSCNHTTYNNQP